MTLEEPYLYCGICFKKSKERTLYLTSCAHIICDDHINLKIKICPKCNVNDISIIKLEENKIPNSIKEIIEPSFEQLNNIQFASKFQYFQLKELIKIFEKENYYLKEKNNKLKDLLRKSRIELNKCNEYQLTINKLKQENKRLNLKLQLSECSNEDNDDEINEISIDEYRLGSSNKNNNNNNSNNSSIYSSGKNKENEDFISKLRKFNQLKSNINIKNRDKDKEISNEIPILNIISKDNENNKQFRNNNNNNNNSENSINEGINNFSSFNIQAESTSIKKRNRSFSMQLNDNLNNESIISNDVSPIISSTAGDDYNKEWFKKRNSNNSSNNSDKSNNSNNFRKMFKFKPPSRNITSRSGIKIGNNNSNSNSSSSNNNNKNFNSRFLRSRNEIFKR